MGQKSSECHSQDQGFFVSSTENYCPSNWLLLLFYLTFRWNSFEWTQRKYVIGDQLPKIEIIIKKVSKQNKNIILITIITLHIWLWRRLDVTQQKKEINHRNSQVFTWPLSLFVNISNRLLFTHWQNSCAHRIALCFYGQAVINDCVKTQFGSKLLFLQKMCAQMLPFSSYYTFMEFSIFPTAIHKYSVYAHVQT